MSDNLERLRKDAIAAEQAGRLSQAQAGYARLLRDAPGDGETLRRLIGVLGRMRRFDEQAQRLAAYEAHCASDRDEASYLAGVKAVFAMQRQRWVEARQLLLEAVAAAPERRWQTNALVNVAMQLNDMDTLRHALHAMHGFDHDISRYRAIRLAGNIQFFAMDSTSNAIMATLFSGEYEACERDLARNVFGAGDRVIEFGSGIGAVTTCLAQSVGADCLLSMDGHPDLIAIARATAAANGHDVEIIHGIAVADGNPSHERFYLGADFWASATEDRGTTVRAVDVPSYPLADLIDRHQANSLCLDIEGAEYELLMSSDLTAIDKIVVELHPMILGDKACSEIIDRLISDGFAVDTRSARDQVFAFSR